MVDFFSNKFQLVLEGKVTVVALDKDYRPIRIPSKIKAKFVKYIRENEGEQSEED